MAIPIQREIEIPLLHLINSSGGAVKPEDTYETLADYFKLTKAEREKMYPDRPVRIFEHRVRWTRQSLVHKGFVDNSVRGVWKITEKGRKELAKYGLLDKTFPNIIVHSHQKKEVPLEVQDLITQVINELLPDGIKKFPDDFLDSKGKIKFREISIPGTILQLAPYSRDTIVSPKGYFRYKAKNPPEALYILYSNHIGKKVINIPEDNLTIFKAVKSYEKYIKDLEQDLFKKFLELTFDESISEQLKNQAIHKLNIKKVQ